MKYRTQENGTFTTLTLSPFARWTKITDLKKFEYYEVLVMAFTSKGDGVAYSATILTDQDGELKENSRHSKECLLSMA